MFNAWGLALVGAFMLSSADPPEIAGVWFGEDWGTVVLNRANPGEYTGSYSESVAAKSGEIQLKWSQTETRYNGSWREGKINSAKFPSGSWATRFAVLFRPIPSPRPITPGQS